MMKQITKVIILVSLMPSLRTQEEIQYKNPLSKEQDRSDESKQKLNEGVRENSGQNNFNLLNDDITSTQVKEQKNEHISLKLLSENRNHKGLAENIINPTESNDRQKHLTKNIELNKEKLKIPESRNKSKNFDSNSESDQDEQISSEPSSQDTDLIDDIPSLDKKATSKLNKNGTSQATEKGAELDNYNTDLIFYNRAVKDEQESFNHLGREAFIDTSPNLDEDNVTEHHKNIDDRQNPTERTTEHNSYLYTLIEINPKPEQKHSEHLNVNRKQDRVIHLEHSMISDHDFAFMAAVVKGGKYVCAGALIDENWVLTAANGIHLMRETIRSLRIRLGSINYKKGGTLLPIKYFETHPYFKSSKPDYDLALLMLSKPVRYTAKIRSIRLQLIPKDVTATHFIMTSWHADVRPGLNKSKVEVIKHHRILSVAHLHPTDPEDCLQELKEIGAGHDRVMCLEGGAEDTCVRDTGAPVVINGVLWGVISSWKPQECDDEVSTFATLVSERNISTWLHATVHGHRWHPE